MSFYIQNVSSGLVLDIKDGNKEQGASIILWPYSGSKNQLWEIKNGVIVSKLHGLALDLSLSNGDVIVWEAHGRSNQQWKIESDVVKNSNGQVLDVSGGKMENGAKLIVSPNNGGAGQKFKMVKK